MKLIFEGTKRLEEIEDFKGCNTLDDYRKNIPDIHNSILWYEGEHLSDIWELNKFFRDGYSLPLKGLEIPIEIKKDDNKIYDSKVVEWLSKEYPEITARGYGTVVVEDERHLLFDSDLEIKFRNRKDSPLKIYSVWGFGRNSFGEIVLDYLKKDVKGTQKEEQLESIIQNSNINNPKDIPESIRSEENYFHRIMSKFLNPKRKISSDHIKIVLDEENRYVLSDLGSYLGTWVSGKKIGLESHPYLWEAVKFFHGRCRELSVYDTDKRMYFDHCKRFHEDVGIIRRFLNEGYKILEDNSEIILGKNEFKDQYKFRFKV